jgi:hypothetical protein
LTASCWDKLRPEDIEHAIQEKEFDDNGRIATMLQTLLISTPFFALVLLGFVAGQRKMLQDTAVAGLNAYVLYFALPCMLWRLGSRTSVQAIFDPVLFAIYALSALSVVALTMALSRRWGMGSGDAAMGALVAAFPNSGFLGLPLLISLLGPNAGSPVMLTLWVDMVLTSSLCIALSPGLTAQGQQLAGFERGKTWGGIFKTVLTNPLPWAIGLGAWCSAHGFELPRPLESTIDLLANSASPVALFALGGVLSRVHVKGAEQPNTSVSGPLNAHHLGPDWPKTPSAWQGVERIAVIKLLVHPVLVVILVQLALQCGMTMDPFSVEVLVLVAALPSASNVVLLAYRQGASQERIARIVMLTTVVSFLSFSVIKTAYEWFF